MDCFLGSICYSFKSSLIHLLRKGDSQIIKDCSSLSEITHKEHSRSASPNIGYLFLVWGCSPVLGCDDCVVSFVGYLKF